MTRLITILLFCLGLSNVLSGQCEIGNLIVEPFECDNGEFFVHLDFDFANNEGDQFGVVGNGTNYGLFPYASLPITLGPLPGNGTTEWEFVVFDAENPECDAVFILGPVSCCGFNELFVADIICTNQESYSAVLNFNPVSTGNLGFDVFANNGEFLGFFLYDNLPVTVTGIPIFNIGVTSLMICDNDNPDCCEAIEFPEPECPGGECEIWNIDVLFSDCENGNFFITLGFNHENGSGSFTVNGNGNNYGTFSYEDLPITLGPLEGDGETIYEFVITDSEIESCNDFVVLEPVNCTGDCDIFDLVAEAFECDPVTNTFALYLNFEWSGEVENFDVFKGGEHIGFVNGANLPDTIYGLTDDGGGALITVCANDNPDCCASIEIDVPQCGEEPCDIFDLVAEAFECDPETNTFALYLNFEWIGEVENFDVFKGGQHIGFVNGANLPDTIYGLTDDGGGALITVCANDHPDCCASDEILVPQCGEEPCDVFELVAEAFECDPETNTFALYLDFEWTGEVENFDVFKGGQHIGFVNGANLPDTIYGLTDDGGGALITVCANDNADCCASIEIDVPQCGEEPCDIFELVAEAFECNPATNTFALYLDFEWEGDIENFDVFKGDVHIGFVNGANLPDTIYGLTDDGGGALITVCANDNADCCASIEIDVPQCGEEPCDISELIVEAFDCDTATNTFAIYLDFDWIGNDEVFNVYKGDLLIGTVIGAQLPDTIYGLTDNGGGALITVCAVNHPDCCASREVAVPDCGDEECEIFEVNVDTGDCTSDSTFQVAITYLYQGFTNEFVELWTGDTYLGFFHIDIQPIIINNFPWNGQNVMPLRICQNDHPDCCRTIEFEVPDCGGECSIFEVSVEPIVCTSDTTFGAIVSFLTQGFDGPIQVWAGDDYLGVFPPVSPLLLTNIPEHEGGVVLTLCQAENPACCTQAEFQGLSCADGCMIGGLTATPSDCDSSGMFYVTLDFDFVNEGAGFAVLGNGTNYGIFSYSQVPLTLGPLPGDGTTVWEFLVVDLGNVGCSDVAGLEPISCDTTGIFSGPHTALPLDIHYNAEGALIMIPEGATSLSMWTYDGRLIPVNETLTPGERLSIDKYISIPGLYFVQVRTAERVYVGKVVGF